MTKLSEFVEKYYLLHKSGKTVNQIRNENLGTSPMEIHEIFANAIMNGHPIDCRSIGVTENHVIKTTDYIFRYCNGRMLDPKTLRSLVILVT